MNMKPKLLLCLALVLSGLFTALSARAGSMWTQLDSANLNTQRLGFTIKTEKAKDGLHFVVTIESKDATISPFLDAHLTVFDGEKQIVEGAASGHPMHAAIIVLKRAKSDNNDHTTHEVSGAKP
jgi:hypothetical protein